MIRFTDIVPEPKPKKAVVTTPEREPAAPLVASATTSGEVKPAKKAPRKPKKSA